MNLKTRLRAARINAKMSQDVAGSLVKTIEKPDGVSKQAVSHWEHGVNTPSSSQLAIFCKIYNVSADYLLFGKDVVLTAHETELISAYRSASNVGRKIIDDAVDTSRMVGRLAGEDTETLRAKIKK